MNIFMLRAVSVVCLGILASAASAGRVLRVGPTQTYATVQAAVNAAVNGDLILVDPGTYPSFVIDTTRLSVVAASGTFTIQKAPGLPAITVRNVPLGEVVSVLGAVISYADPSSPAIVVRNNPGAVRFSRLTVSLDGNLPLAVVRAAVEVDATATFWLIDSQIWSATGRSAATQNATGANDGVSALELLNSDGVVQNSMLRGYDNPGQYAGDGLRASGNSSVWLRDDITRPGSTQLVGGNGGAFGGHAAHLLGATSPDLITMCQAVNLSEGSGVTSGGKYGINNNNGIRTFPCGPAICTSYRLPDLCSGQQLSEANTLNDTVSIGGTINVRVFTPLSRNYVLVQSTTTLYVRTVAGHYGRSMVDPSSYTVIAAGTTPGGTLTVPVAIPNLAVLRGWQLTFQAATGPVAGGTNALSGPALLVITP